MGIIVWMMNFYVFWYHADPPIDTSSGRYSRRVPREDLYDSSDNDDRPSGLQRAAEAASMGA